jgi:hypothetical protein
MARLARRIGVLGLGHGYVPHFPWEGWVESGCVYGIRFM